MATLKELIIMHNRQIIIDYGETYFWGMIQLLQLILPLFILLGPVMAISYSLLLSALPILLLYFNGALIASIKLLLILGSPLYSLALSNISMLMARKMEEISLECFRQLTGLSNGFFTILEAILVLHIVLAEALSMIRKS
jgi:hypothetical protein